MNSPRVEFPTHSLPVSSGRKPACASSSQTKRPVPACVTSGNCNASGWFLSKKLAVAFSSTLWKSAARSTVNSPFTPANMVTVEKRDKTVRQCQRIPGQCWSVDPILNGISWESEFLFRRVVDNTNSRWRLGFPADGMENRIRGLCFSPARRSKAWPPQKIRSHVNELVGAGILRHVEHGGRCWLEVGEWLRYREGQNAAAGPPGADEEDLIDRSVRWYQTIPGRCWTVDALLNGVSWEAEYLFRRMVDNVDYDWRIEYSPDGLENRIRGLCFSSERRSLAWSASKIARHMSELLAAGIVRRLDRDGRCWLEVAARLQYVKGQNPAAGPPLAEQTDLGLQPTLFSLPSPPEKPGAFFDAATSNGIRRLKEEKKIDSAPSRGNAPVLPEPPQQQRHRSGENHPYACTTHELCATPLGRRLSKFIGLQQMAEEVLRSGMEWLRILRSEPTQLANALDTLERQTKSFRTGKHRAQRLTQMLGEWRKNV
jgi:hypothetical protein